jgi:hypothetical protein
MRGPVPPVFRSKEFDRHRGAEGRFVNKQHVEPAIVAAGSPGHPDPISHLAAQLVEAFWLHRIIRPLQDLQRCRDALAAIQGAQRLQFAIQPGVGDAADAQRSRPFRRKPGRQRGEAGNLLTPRQPWRRPQGIGLDRPLMQNHLVAVARQLVTRLTALQPDIDAGQIGDLFRQDGEELRRQQQLLLGRYALGDHPFEMRRIGRRVRLAQCNVGGKAT